MLLLSASFTTPWTVARQAPLSMAFPNKNTGVGCHLLLQGIFPTQGSNRISGIGRRILYCLATRQVLARHSILLFHEIWQLCFRITSFNHKRQLYFTDEENDSSIKRYSHCHKIRSEIDWNSGLLVPSDVLSIRAPTF